MLEFLLSVLIWSAVIAGLWVGSFFLAYWLAGKDMFFTIVDQGTEKQIMRLGAWVRTLKEPGFHFIGIWPFYKVYSYWFGWTGVRKDGTFEEHPTQLLTYVLTKEDVYALKVRDAEDKNLVPLEWLITMTVKIVDSRKALFEIENWLETLFNRIGPYVRDFSGLYAYEELVQGKEGKKMELEQEILERLNRPGTIDESDRDNINKSQVLDKRSILAKFEQDYGVHIRALEVVDIDPDEHFRKLTLQKRQGQANADQAIAETTGRVKKAVAELSSVEGVSAAEIYKDANDQVKRDRAGDKGELSDVRVGNTDGTAFTAGVMGPIVGGITSAMNQLAKAIHGVTKEASEASDSGTSRKRNRGRKGKPRADWTDEDADEVVKRLKNG